MSGRSTNRKSDFIKLMLSEIQATSTDKSLSKEFLQNEGLNLARMQAEGIKRIKRMQLQVIAEQTKEEMSVAEAFSEKALALVENLMSSASFSFAKFLKEENLTLSFRNFENLSEEDIKAILTKHYTLKIMEENRDRSNPESL